MSNSANKIEDSNILNVIYPKNKGNVGSNKYDAIGICKINLSSTDIRRNDKCAFSQFKLSECESISALIYSQTSNKSKASTNEWKYLCDDGDFNKIHLFDSDYLKTWIEMKGCEFIHCPLCKSGVYEEKEQIEEHDIDSMEQLKERREEAKKENDLYMTFHVEQLILDKACTQIWNLQENQNKLLFNQDILREVLNHWISKKKIDEFRDKIIESMTKCIEKDNIEILKILLKYCGYDKLSSNLSRNQEIISFINTAAKSASFDCISLLLKSPNKLDWSSEKRPIVLLNAVKFHPENLEMINFIMDKLELLKIIFVCDDVMEQVIKYDLVNVAKRIVNNRWHKITKENEELAAKINLNCNIYFNERSNAMNFSTMNSNDDGLDFDPDDWGNDDDDNNNDDGDDDDDNWDENDEWDQ